MRSSQACSRETEVSLSTRSQDVAQPTSRRPLSGEMRASIGSTEKAINYFSSDIDLSWLKEPYPIKVHRGTIVSGDRDILPEDIQGLKDRYGAKVGDWESGSISFVCRHNGVKLVILRGVSDLVDSDGGDAYGERVIWVEAAERIIRRLIDSLPGWLSNLRE